MSNKSCKKNCCVTFVSTTQISGGDIDNGVVINTPGGLVVSPDLTFDDKEAGCTGVNGTLTTPNLVVGAMMDVGAGINFGQNSTSDPCPDTAGTLWVDPEGNVRLDDSEIDNQNCMDSIDYCKDYAAGARPWQVTTTTSASNTSNTLKVGVPVIVGSYLGSTVYRAYFYGTITNANGAVGSMWQSQTTLGPLPKPATQIIDWGGSWVGGDSKVHNIGGYQSWSGAAFYRANWSNLYIDTQGDFVLTTFNGGISLLCTFIATPIIPSYFSDRRNKAPFICWVDYITDDFATMAAKQGCGA